LKNPVTEPKRPVRRPVRHSFSDGGSQKSKRPLVRFNLPNGYSVFENALLTAPSAAQFLA
jgi:hypothetical protein